MKKALLILLLIPVCAFSQNYTSYFTGSSTDVVTTPSGGICIMGGATEDDNAMRWFLQRANGGDVLVLRASGSDGYNSYLYSELGVPVNSVESIVCHNAAASNAAYLHQKINQAEAIWFAGGDQWKYVSYWRNTPIANLVNQAIRERNIVVGGTSAGLAIMGQYYFSAQNGTVTSEEALGNPYNSFVTVDSTAFIRNEHLKSVITDSHFDDPDRRGRLVVFLSRILTDYGVRGKAIACDEYTAVCIDTTGIARVYGGGANYDDNAYFIQPNCDLADFTPEICSALTPLTWNKGGKALKAYQVKGTPGGQNSFDLNDWKTGAGGQWLHWSVNEAFFTSQNGDPLMCSVTSLTDDDIASTIQLYPNPVTDKLTVSSRIFNARECKVEVFNGQGQKVKTTIRLRSENELQLDTSPYTAGIYHLVLTFENRPSAAFSFIRTE